MSAECCAADAHVPEGGARHSPPLKWWRNFGLALPAASGAMLIAGLILEWVGSDLASQVAFWIGLLLGAATFVPGALVSLFRRRTVGIALLMTISAVGAVVLGFVGEAAALAFLYALAEALEDAAMVRAREGLRAVLHLVPERATVLDRGTWVNVPASSILIGQRLLVRPGERIATDGVVRAGRSALDTAVLTGESIPVDVGPGDPVSAGAINASGVLEIETVAAGSDNSLTTIVELVERAHAERGARARLADRIAQPLVPGVIVLAMLVAGIGALLGDPETWITRALVVLVAASPCALAIAVPVTVISAIGAATRFGVIVKSGAAFELLGSVRHVALDKTGTLTRNEPTVSSVIADGDVDEARVLELAASLEQFSTHPLARAVTRAAPQLFVAEQVREEAGWGVSGLVEGLFIAVGSPRWIDAGRFRSDVAALEADGQTCALVARDGVVVGVIGVRDELRPEAAAMVRTLKDRDIRVSMLTGDNARTAVVLAQQAGIADVHAALRPEDKAELVAAFSAAAPTAMIGDGVNDAPALAGATVGIAMGVTGSDAAVQSAEIAFTGHDLRLIPKALAHARRGRAIMNQNIVLSIAIVVILVPLAVSGVLGLAAVVLVHEIAELVVIANGLRAARTH
ncbi:cation-transporting ATPase G [Leucobacter luti]|uniref:heavy metal translocating P-type ATPase n=1 Tax=Leucobacter luti TaxID=340320 RepID=UPI001053AF73|nr:cation-translocating P-type ATPase [Leucobacter luti]MCW2287440.1 cation-transporting ATPase G [Leucobacter luti]TCK41663.1 cation-transporting ATPase G [Leucobacter luti]